MQSFFFWKSWDRDSKILYGIVTAVFLLAIAFFLTHLILGGGSILNWESLVQSYTSETGIGIIGDDPFQIDLNIESIVFVEYFGGSNIEINSLGYHLFLVIFGISISVLLAISTTLPRFWYMVTTGLFVVVLILFKFELLTLFNLTGRSGLITALILYLPVSYYFQSLNSNVRLKWRVLTFAGITALFGLLIYFFAGVPNPFIQVAVYAITPSLIITLIVVLLVSHEIVAGFLNAVTSGGSQSVGNWKHFFIISTIYLVNITLLYLKEVRVIDWELIPINTFVILLISILIGVWGYKQREPQYEYLFPFFPLGALFYMAAASIAIGTIGYFYATGNDPVLDVIEDVILFAHLGYGLIFILYVVSNFLSLMTRNLPISRVLYMPEVMPYFTFRLAGLIAFGALLFLENWEIPFEKSVSGYYNGLGDLYTENEDFLLARGYYEEASLYGRSDHKSNYALAQNAFLTEDIGKSIYYYDRSNYSWPTEYSYANLSNIYFAQGRFFDAIFELKEGLNKFPNSGPLMNNLGVLYSKMELYDSAFIYLGMAEGFRKSRSAAKNNMLAILTESNSPLDSEKLNDLLETGDPINQANLIAAENGWKRGSERNFDVENVSNNQFTHAFLYNSLINNLWKDDTLVFAKVDQMREENIFFARRIDLAMALNYYKIGEVGKAIVKLKGIRNGERAWTSKIDRILGYWHLENNDFETALNYFKSSKENYHKEGLTTHAIALTISGHFEDARLAWDSVRKTKNPVYLQHAEKIIYLMKLDDPNEIRTLSDLDKIQWLQFHPKGDVFDVASTFNDTNYRAKAVLGKGKSLLLKDELEESFIQMELLNGLEISEVELKEEVALFSMELFARMGKTTQLASLLDQGFVPSTMSKLDYYEALLAVSRGDSSKAEILFNKIGARNPFDEGSIIAASRFFENRNNREKAYAILQEASSININSIPLQKAYIGICGRFGYDVFGFYVLDLLEPKISAKEYKALVEQFTTDLSMAQEIF